MALDLELIGEHHPTIDGTKRVEAALRIPRKTFRAHAEAPDVSTAIDRVRDKLERQVRDHHGKKRSAQKPRGIESARNVTPAED
jgi:ribosomal subunit interface protein